MERTKMLLSTIATDAAETAGANGLGLEIAEFCTAFNFDQYFLETDRKIREEIRGIDHLTYHAPFNELFPCAIDPKARELARYRYHQAIDAGAYYGTKKIIVHSGYAPNFYYDCWFEEQSILFWKEFAGMIPEDVTICVENVLETQPEPLLHILEGVDHPNIRMCLDIGHANAYSERPVMEWLELFAPWIAHFHIHNNGGKTDEHKGLWEGTIPMEKVLIRAQELCPDATFAMEIMETAPSVVWLEEKGFLEDRK